MDTGAPNALSTIIWLTAPDRKQCCRQLIKESRDKWNLGNGKLKKKSDGGWKKKKRLKEEGGGPTGSDAAPSFPLLRPERYACVRRIIYAPIFFSFSPKYIWCIISFFFSPLFAVVMLSSSLFRPLCSSSSPILFSFPSLKTRYTTTILQNTFETSFLFYKVFFSFSPFLSGDGVFNESLWSFHVQS